MISPYIVSGPVTGSDFYGRGELLAEIAAGRQRAFYILGPRQIGKTSLLQQLDSQLPALFLDVQWAAGRLPELISQAGWELDRKRARFPWLPAPGALPDDDLFALLRTINDHVQAAGQTLRLLVDEAEGLLALAGDDPSILHRLRGTIQNCPALRVVLVAAKTLSKVNELSTIGGLSPFLSGFTLRYLGGLNWDETADLLRQRQTPAQVRADDELVSHLFDLTNGYPLLLQLLGERLFDRGSLRPPDEDDLIAIGDTLERLGIFSTDFAYLTNVERRVLRALIKGKPVPADVDPAFLHGLTQLGYLRREGDSYAIGNAFFARWLRQSAPWREKSRVSDEGTLNLYKVGVLRQERIASLRRQLDIHIKNLNRLEERAARHGMDVPTRLRNEMDCEREAIARIEAELEQVRGKT